MSPTGLVELYQEFEQLTDALVDRFEIPTPDTPPYSESCPPAHEDSKAFLTIRLQNYWVDFWYGLIYASAYAGQPTLTGRTLSPVFPGSSIDEMRRQVRGIARAVAETMINKPDPIWHSCEYTVNVARQLGLQNFNEIDFGLSPNRTAGFATGVRNYVVHPEAGSKERFMRVAAAHGMPFSEPAALLRSPQLGGSTLFEDWVRDLQGAARKAAE